MSTTPNSFSQPNAYSAYAQVMKTLSTVPAEERAQLITDTQSAFDGIMKMIDQLADKLKPIVALGDIVSALQKEATKTKVPK